jgi:thioredoxin reductase (NADPH)
VQLSAKSDVAIALAPMDRGTASLHNKPMNTHTHTQPNSLPGSFSCDVLIIGGGPGGLSAAIYLRRFQRNVLLVDKGNSRLSLIPVTHNYGGFPDGIPGHQLQQRLRDQLAHYDTHVTAGEVTSLTRIDGGRDDGGEGHRFIAEFNDTRVRARAVILASGVADAGLPIDNWREAVRCGAVRLCPVCDGYDVIDKKISVITSPANPVGHALFMRTFSADVTLFERDDAVPLDAEQRIALQQAGVRYVQAPVKGVGMTERMTPVLHTGDGAEHHCDVLYPMLGESARSELAAVLGAQAEPNCGELLVDEYQRTSVPWLYAVGDVVKGLNQISVAMGQGAVAATNIHANLPPHWRAAPAPPMSP